MQRWFCPQKTLCYDITIGFHLQITVQLKCQHSKLEVHRVCFTRSTNEIEFQAPGKTCFHIYQTDIQTKEVKIQLKYQVPLNAWRNHDRSLAFIFFPLIIKFICTLNKHLRELLSGSFFFPLDLVMRLKQADSSASLDKVFVAVRKLLMLTISRMPKCRLQGLGTHPSSVSVAKQKRFQLPISNWSSCSVKPFLSFSLSWLLMWGSNSIPANSRTCSGQICQNAVSFPSSHLVAHRMKKCLCFYCHIKTFFFSNYRYLSWKYCFSEAFFRSEWDHLPFFFTVSSLFYLMFLNALFWLHLQCHGVGICSVNLSRSSLCCCCSTCRL